MRGITNELYIRDYNNSPSNYRGFIIHFFKNRFLVLKDNQGFIDLYNFGIFFIILIICFTTIIGIGFSGHRLAVMTYDWFGSSMNYASSAASMHTIGSDLVLNDSFAKEYFISSFSEMTNTNYSNNTFSPKQDSPYPGEIILKRFEPVTSNKANKAGYIAEIEVPVIGTRVPLIGYQSIKVPMKYHAVGRNTEL